MSLTRASLSMIGWNGPFTISDDTTITGDVFIGEGQVITVAPGKTLTFSGFFTAGPYPVFSAGSSVKFNEGVTTEVFPEWWSGEFGAAVSSAFSSIKDVGGKITFTKSHNCTTPINATGCHRGMIWEGRGNSGSGVPTVTIAFAHSGVGFDCSDSEHFIFQNINFKGGPLAQTTSPTVFPSVGFLFARNSVGSGCGKHSMTNVVFDYWSVFQIAALYTYGAEEMIYINCHFRNKNAVGGGQVAVITSANAFSVSSPNITIATGVQSNTVHKFIGGAMTQEGIGTSNVLYLEGVGELSVDGGLFFGYGCRSLFYLDNTHQAALYVASFRNIRQELDSSYVFYANGVNTGISYSPYNITVENNRFAQTSGSGQYFLYADNGVTLYDWTIRNNTSPGILNAQNIRLSNIDFSDTIVTRAGGNVESTILKSNEAVTTINGGFLTSQFYGQAYGGLAFTGVQSTYQPPIGTLTLSAGTSTAITAVPYIKSNARVFLMPTNSGAAGLASVYVSAITAGTGFTITHSSAAGTETFNYFIVNTQLT